jgi:Lon protease-like protein
MTNFIPVFPLGIVVYPGENLNLHIFEPRYKQLIQDVQQGGKPFGIPTVIDGKIKEMGSLVELVEVTRVYDNGEMDIRTRGLSVFRILELVEQIPDKLFTGAIVTYPTNHLVADPDRMRRLIEDVRKLHRVLNIQKQFAKPDNELISYDIAHHAGLALHQEYELLELMHEMQREEYLARHLSQVIPVVEEMETLRERVKLNGHFRHLPGLNL